MSRLDPSGTPLGRALRLVAVVAVYVVAARAGLALDAVSGFASVVWPASAIALVTLLHERRLWPGIFVGAAVANAMVGAKIPVALGIATGNTLEGLLGAMLLSSIPGFRMSLDRLVDALGLAVLAAFLATSVSATIGVATLWLGGVVASAHVAETWRAWWFGDMIGILVFAPPLLVWFGPTTPIPRPRRAEVALFFVAAVVLNALAMGLGASSDANAYLYFPLLIWAAVRYGVRGTVATLLGVLAIASTATVLGVGPFSHPQFHQSLLALQQFMGVASATFVVLGAAISERSRTVLALRAARGDLERRVAERTADLKRANEVLLRQENDLKEAQAELERRVEARTRELHEAVNARDALISIASHELRTPLTALQLQLQLLAKQHADSRVLPAVVGQAGRLARLITNLLEVSRITAGTLQLEPTDIDLSQVAHDVVAHYRAETRGAAQLTVADGGEVRGLWDPIRLEQIVNNLVSNAVKYGAGQPIEVRVERAGDLARLVVEDHGIGIAPADQARIFERFERLVSERSVGGFGLGLWIVRQIVDAMDGEISVRSAVGEGSQFTVELPVRPGVRVATA